MWLKIQLFINAILWLVEPSAPPANVQGHNTSSTSIWVDWDIVPVADQNGIVLTYTVTYIALPDETPQSIVLIAAITQANLTGLTKYRNYSITVFASTAKGDGNVSEPIIVITDEDSKFFIVLVHFQTLIQSYEKIISVTFIIFQLNGKTTTRTVYRT